MVEEENKSYMCHYVANMLHISYLIITIFRHLEYVHNFSNVPFTGTLASTLVEGFSLELMK